MNDPENFIARWSRRKRNAADDAKPAVARPPAATSTESAEQPREKSDPAPVVSGPSEAGFDLTKLPSVDTITADTDIRAFLAPGVPAELTRAALRRAWAADPKIRDFIGLSENAWDFNAPGAIGGFGPLEMTDELRQQITRMVGRSIQGAAAGQSGSPEREAQPSRPDTPPRSAGPEVQSDEIATRAEAAPEKPEKEPQQHNARPDAAALPQRNKADIAPQPDSANDDDDQLIAKRLHGRALPE